MKDFERLVRLLLAVGHSAGELVSSIRSSGVSIQEKTIGDPVTDADFCAQYLIVSSILKEFPDIAILAEEDPAEVLQVASDPRLNTILSSHGDITPHTDAVAIPAGLEDASIDECVVIIDPIDGTKHFVLHDLPGSVVLIGVAYRGRAVFGLVNQFCTETIVYGIVDTDGVGSSVGVDGLIDRLTYRVPVLPDPVNGGSLQSIDLAKTSETTTDGAYHAQFAGHPHVWMTPRAIADLRGPNTCVLVTTDVYWRPAHTALVAAVRPTHLVQTGGTGHKVLLFLAGAVDVYSYPAPGPKFWDSAAVQAVAAGAGRSLTDNVGNPLRFPTVTELAEFRAAHPDAPATITDEACRHRYGLLGIDPASHGVDRDAIKAVAEAAAEGRDDLEFGWGRV